MQPRATESPTVSANRPARTTAARAERAEKIRVLYAGDMEFARAQFASEAPALHLIAVTEALAEHSSDAQTALGGRQPADVAFIDCCSPSVNAAALIEELRSRRPAVPVVLAVDPGGEERAKIAVDLQADDYTIKTPGWLARLPSRLTIAIARHRQLSQLEAVQGQERRLRSIVEAAPACLTRVGRDGTILAMNDSARSMIGAEQPSDVLGKTLFSFLNPEEVDASRQYVETLCDGQPGSMEFSLTAISGIQRVLQVGGIALPPDGKGRASALLVLRDITELRRFERSVMEKASTERAAGARLVVDESTENEALKQQLSIERTRTEALARRLHDIEAEYERAATQSAQIGQVQLALEEARTRHTAEIADERATREQLQTRVRDQALDCKRLEDERNELQRLFEEARTRDAEKMGADREVLEQRLRRAAAHCRRLAGERNDRDRVAQGLQSELERLLGQRKAERKELVSALQGCERYEQLAIRHATECAELEQALVQARAEFVELSEWAHVRSTAIANRMRSGTVVGSAGSADEPSPPGPDGTPATASTPPPKAGP